MGGGAEVGWTLESALAWVGGGEHTAPLEHYLRTS